MAPVPFPISEPWTPSVCDKKEFEIVNDEFRKMFMEPKLEKWGQENSIRAAK